MLRFVTAMLLLGLVASPARSEEFAGKVVGVIDGDTVDVLRDDKAVRIRLEGIDCPEKGQAFGTKAKEATSDLAFGKVVTVKVTGKDRYGRMLAELILPDGRNLNRELVRTGFAWWFKKYSKDESLGKLEDEAHAAKVGLWADKEPVPPWEFRAAKVKATK